MFVDDVPGSALIPKKNKFDALIYIFCFIPFFMQPELMAYYGEHFAKMIHTILHALNVYKYFNPYIIQFIKTIKRQAIKIDVYI